MNDVTAPAAAEAASAALHRTLKANFNNLVDVVDVKFHFKKSKDEATGLESKRPTVEIAIPKPSVEGIAKIYELGGKGLDLLLEAVGDIVIYRAREIINENENITAANFPYEQLSWEAIANLPKAERRGGGIAKEVWEEFGKDYITVMPSVTGKTVEQVTNASKLLVAKFTPVKTNKKVIALLKEQLALYLSNSPQAEQFSECVDFLTTKADTLLAADEAALLANL